MTYPNIPLVNDPSRNRIERENSRGRVFFSLPLCIVPFLQPLSLLFVWLFLNFYLFTWILFWTIFWHFVLTFDQISGYCDQGFGSNFSSCFLFKRKCFTIWRENQHPQISIEKIPTNTCEASSLCHVRQVFNKCLSCSTLPCYIWTKMSSIHHHQCHYTIKCLFNLKQTEDFFSCHHAVYWEAQNLNRRCQDDLYHQQGNFVSLNTEMWSRIKRP